MSEMKDCDKRALLKGQIFESQKRFLACIAEILFAQ